MSEVNLDDFESSFVDGLKARTLTSCSRWAARRRIIRNVVTGANENYSDKYHPWVRAMHDSWATYNYAMKGAQLGVTEVAINRALYIIDKLKKDVLYVLPTTKTATDFSKARFGGALAMSPYLMNMFTDTNSVGIKQAGPNTLYIRGSRGDSNLVSIPVDELILDEVDRMDQSQLYLALERLSGHIEKHVWGISTPTIPGYGIDLLYQNSTQEHFIFQCPRCSRHTELVWPTKDEPGCIEIIGEHVGDIRCNDSFLKCRECKGRIEHEEKPEFLAKAYWEAFDKNANPNVRGFHINQLYSYTVTPGELVDAYFRGQGNEAAEKEFHNSKLGKPFIGQGARVDDDMLQRSVGGHRKSDPRPSGNRNRSRTITMGIDRGKWNYVEVCEFTYDGYGVDLNANAHAKVLFEGKFLDENFDASVDLLMREWQILACVVDADPGRMEARRFARRFPGYVWLCQYRKGPSARDIVVTDDEDHSPIATVDRAHWLSASLIRFKTDPARIILPCDVSSEYREHMKALTSTYVRDEHDNPKLDFVKTGPDHFAHARTYAEIALPLCAARETNRDIKSFL